MDERNKEMDPETGYKVSKNFKKSFGKKTFLGMFSSVQQGHGWLYHCRRNEVRINKVQLGGGWCPRTGLRAAVNEYICC